MRSYPCGRDLVPWAAERMPFCENFEFAEGANARGVVVDGVLKCVAVYHDFFPQFETISMSLAADDASWASREAYGALLHFPFVELGCESITVWQPIDHVRAYKLVKGVGFKDVGTMRRKMKGVDVRVLDLLKHEAERWLRHTPLDIVAASGGRRG